jgi:glycosyltransferase involved in cell wall biosynthesis
VPGHRRGAEVTLHAVLCELSRRGHEIQVLVGDGGVAGHTDGVEVIVDADRTHALEHCRGADIVVGQLEARWDSLYLAARADRPLVYFMHIGNVPRRALYGRPDLTVFNSETLRQAHPWIDRCLVVHPPIMERDYLCTPGGAITLVNLTAPKGASLFYDLAERLPSHQFIGVRGTGAQVIPERIPANVTVLEPVDDMREVYRRTRILLMPSVYESYGRVGVEGAVSGIPTIAHPTTGVSEALGDSVLYADRGDVGAWIRCISTLDDPTAYRDWSRRARAQFDRLEVTHEIDRLEQALVALAAPR